MLPVLNKSNHFTTTDYMPPERKTKRRTRDLDQIASDLASPRKLSQRLSLLASDDLPGLGQYYCKPCAKFFETGTALSTHERAKTHKKRLRLLKEEPYTQEEANAAAGVGVDNGRTTNFSVSAADILAKVSRFGNKVVLDHDDVSMKGEKQAQEAS